MSTRKHHTFYYLNQAAGKTRWNILLLLLIQTSLSICSVGYALALRNIINAAVAAERPAFFAAVGQFGALILLQLLLQAWNRYLLESTRSTLENRLKERLFAHLLSGDAGTVMAVHSGEWMNRLTNDTSLVANDMTEVLPGFVGMAVRLLGAVLMIVILEPQFCTLIIPGGILLFLCSTIFRKRMKQLHRNIQERDGQLRTFLQETIGSFLIVRSYAAEGEMLAGAKKRMDAHRQARMKRNLFSNISNTGFGAVMNGAYLLGAVFCGYGILTGTMDYGTFTAVLQLIDQVQSPFVSISGYFPRFYAMLASAERLMEAEQTGGAGAPERKELLEVQTAYRNGLEAIGLKDICFRYAPPVRQDQAAMPVVLDGVSLEIPRGAYIAFTGRSGCGKSTVLKLLMCLYHPDSGKRYLRINGKEQELDERWQRLFAYVPQGNVLMSGSIRQIVAFAAPERMQEDSAIREALQIACAWEFVSALEQGIDTVLGERGLGLSEGQMQRISIARAVFSGRPVLMLDECTSALDADTEKRLLENLRRMTDRTVVIVTHRPAALEICDAVCEFDCCDTGSPRVLRSSEP